MLGASWCMRSITPVENNLTEEISKHFSHYRNLSKTHSYTCSYASVDKVHRPQLPFAKRGATTICWFQRVSQLSHSQPLQLSSIHLKMVLVNWVNRVFSSALINREKALSAKYQSPSILESPTLRADAKEWYKEFTLTRIFQKFLLIAPLSKPLPSNQMVLSTIHWPLKRTTAFEIKTIKLSATSHWNISVSVGPKTH